VSDPQANRCDFAGAPSDPGAPGCDMPARERTVQDEHGQTAQVELCGDHFAYVSDRNHVHYWYVDRATDGSRTLIRMARPTH
jgi:hypothetical protein